MQPATMAGPPQGIPQHSMQPEVAYVLRHADDQLILAQQLAGWISNGPELEEDIAVGNLALDHLGRARMLLSHAGTLEGAGRTEDDLAMFRSEREFTNLLLVEQLNGDFADTTIRSLLFDVFQLGLWGQLQRSTDETLAAVAAKALKETAYHVRHWSTWTIRLGDGTRESHQRAQNALDRLWRFTDEMFLADEIDMAMDVSGLGIDPASLRDEWHAQIAGTLGEATLLIPHESMQRSGGRQGFHTEHLGHLLAEMQWMQRSHPGLEW